MDEWGFIIKITKPKFNLSNPKLQPIRLKSKFLREKNYWALDPNIPVYQPATQVARIVLYCKTYEQLILLKGVLRGLQKVFVSLSYH